MPAGGFGCGVFSWLRERVSRCLPLRTGVPGSSCRRPPVPALSCRVEVCLVALFLVASSGRSGSGDQCQWCIGVSVLAQIMEPVFVSLGSPSVSRGRYCLQKSLSLCKIHSSRRSGSEGAGLLCGAVPCACLLAGPWNDNVSCLSMARCCEKDYVGFSGDVNNRR